MLALCLHSVIIIYMKINDNNPPFDPNAEDAVHAILDVLNQMFIQPAYNAGEIDEEDEEVEKWVDNPFSAELLYVT